MSVTYSASDTDSAGLGAQVRLGAQSGHAAWYPSVRGAGRPAVTSPLPGWARPAPPSSRRWWRDMFIPNQYVPLTEAVVEAFAAQHSDAILTAGLRSHEAKQIATHWLARERWEKAELHKREGTRFARCGKKMTGIVPQQLTANDRALAQETEELRALANKSVPLRPLLERTWNDLRSRLSAGQIIGYLADPDSGKFHKIAAHEWNRDDADIAHVTGCFSVAYGWGRVAGPVLLLQSDIQRRVSPAAVATKKSRAGRRRGSTDYDWDEGKMFALNMLSKMGDFANSANRVQGWKNQADLESEVILHLAKSGKQPGASTTRERVSSWLREWRSQQRSEN
jgi:hypothetical protein